jgi:NADPH:quinone reductase-like Zn-dependent oxidoreductase
MSFVDAAPGTEGSHHALTYILEAKIGAGDDVLVYGATGAIRSAAVQLLKHLGANVTAVCATDHLRLVAGLGADRVIDYTAEDFTAGEQRYDLVFDAVGKRSFGECRRLLKPRGIYASTDLGPRSKNPVLALVTPLRRGKRVQFPLPSHDQEMIRYLGGLMESEAFRPVIDRQPPLQEIADTYRCVETGQKIGNVVVIPE